MLVIFNPSQNLDPAAAADILLFLFFPCTVHSSLDFGELSGEEG